MRYLHYGHEFSSVEDDSLTGALLRDALRLRGFDTIVVRDAQHAIDIARQHRPALMLVDLRLPGVSGWELVRMLKADPDLASIPVVAVSVMVMPADRERALEAGCLDFIQKPFDVRQLYDLVGRFIGSV